MADGRITFDTKIDISGVEKGLKEVSEVAKSGVQSLKSLSTETKNIGENSKKNVSQAGENLKSASEKGAKALKKVLDVAEQVGSGGKKALEGVAKAGEKIGKITWKALDTSIKTTTTSLTALSASMGAFLMASVKSGQQFESSMSQVIATMGITKDAVTNIDGTDVNVYDMLADKAKEMGAKTKFSASEAADALNYLALAGYDAQKACNALPIVLDLAAAGGMDLAYASDLATDAMSALNMEATTENLTAFGDSMAKTASRANTNVAQLGEAILVCGGQATLAGMDLTQMNTALGILADNGIKGSEGGTALRNVLKNLYTPVQDASKALEELSVQTSNIDTGELLPVQNILQQINTALSNLNNDALKMEYMGRIFDTRTIAAGNALLNNSVDRWNELSAEVSNCNGSMAQMAETMNDNLTGQVTIFKSALEGVNNLVYENMGTPLKNLVKNGTAYLDEFNEALQKGGFIGLGQAIGDVLIQSMEENETIFKNATITGQTVINCIIDGIRDNSEEISEKISNGITTGLYALNDNFTGFYNLGFKMVSQIADGISKNPDFIENLVNDFISNVSSTFFRYSADLLQSGTVMAKSIIKGFLSASKSVSGDFSEFIKSIVNLISSDVPEITQLAVNLITDVVKNISDNLKDSKITSSLLKSGANVLKIILSGLSKSSKDISKSVTLIVGEISKVFVSEFPQLFRLGTDIFTALVQGISDGMKENNITSKYIIDTIAKSFDENSDRLLESTWVIISAIGRGISENLPTLAQYALDIVVALAEFLGEHAEKIGSGAIRLILTLAETLLSEENLKRILNCASLIVTSLATGLLSEENMKSLAEVAHGIVNAVTETIFGGEGSDVNSLISAGAYVAGKLLSGLATALFDTDHGIYAILNDLVKSVGEYLADNFWKLGTMVMEGFASGISGIDFSFEDYGEYLFDAKQDGTLWKDYFDNTNQMWSGIFGKTLGFETVANQEQPKQMNALQILDGYETTEELNRNLVISVQQEQQKQQQAMAVLPYFSQPSSQAQTSPFKDKNTNVSLYLYPNSDAFDEACIDAQNRVISRNGGYMND